MSEWWNCLHEMNRALIILSIWCLVAFGLTFALLWWKPQLIRRYSFWDYWAMILLSPLAIFAVWLVGQLIYDMIRCALCVNC